MSHDKPPSLYNPETTKDKTLLVTGDDDLTAFAVTCVVCDQCGRLKRPSRPCQACKDKQPQGGES